MRDTAPALEPAILAIERLDLKPGEILVVRYDPYMPYDKRAHMMQDFYRFLERHESRHPHLAPISAVFLPNDLQLCALTPVSIPEGATTAPQGIPEPR